jgi:inorganic triphosphatase YgiF
MPGLDTEVELKLRLLAPADREGVFGAPALAERLATPPRDEHLETWYFDTAAGGLQDAGLAYRIRLEGGRWSATVKADGVSAGGLHQRREWTVDVDGPEPGYDYFAATEAGPLLTMAGEDEPLELLFRTVFDRRRADVAAGDSLIEAAVDVGTIFAGGREEAIAEVELELKAGSAADVLALGAELVRQVPLAVEPRSKFHRALALAGLDEGSGRLPAPRPEPEDAAPEGVRSLIVGQLGAVFDAYEAFAADRTKPESPYRLRVQLRRLRSLVSLAKPLLAAEGCERWQEELRALSWATHGVREADVAGAVWGQMLAACRPLVPPPWLGLMMATERDRLVAEADAALGQGRLTATLLDFWAWLEGGKAFRPTDRTLAAFVADRLAGWLDEMRETGKDISLADTDGLHRLRVAGKRVRYVLESLVAADRRTKVLVARLRRLQDCLGHIHDAATIGAAMDRWLSEHASRVVHRDAGLLIGWTARLGVEARGEFAPAWKKFRRAARRWRKDL